MTTLFLKNNSKVEVSFVIMTSRRTDPLYTSTLYKGCGSILELGEDTVIEIITEDYYVLKKVEADLGHCFPDNEVIIYRLDNYHTPRGMHILDPDNTLIGVEMRDGSKVKPKSSNKIKKKNR
ncbi:MAG: hypothetical protein IAE93_01265 [Ignavibacteria bacterium]|nr:hypothetical protein [Ignavibacteria bacterium]